MSYEVHCSNKNCLSAKKLFITAQCIGIHPKFTQTKSTKEKTQSTQAALLIYDGTKLPVSVAIRYLARLRPDLYLYGRTFIEMALVDKTLRHSEYHILLPLETLSSIENRNGAAAAEITRNIESAFAECLEPHLLSSTYLVGERLTIADIDLALSLAEAFDIKLLPHELLTKFESVSRWLELILSQEEVKRFYTPKTMLFPERHTLLTYEKKDDESRHKQSKNRDKKQADPVSSSTEVEDIEKKIEQEKKKKENPLDLLPPTFFVLDTWKREYSNCKDLRNIAMPWFWEHYDPQGWSLWYMRYDKIEGENTKSYTTSNLLGGFLQRLDPAFRQYSFAVINVVGKDDDFDIVGVWLLRGLDIPPQLKEHPSIEYHTFKLLDITKPEDKNLVEDYWCNDDYIEGRPIDSCKVWK